MAQGDVGGPAGRTGAGIGATLAAPGGAKLAAGPPKAGALEIGRCAGPVRCAIMTSGGMRSSNTTTMRSRRRLADSTLTV